VKAHCLHASESGATTFSFLFIFMSYLESVVLVWESSNRKLHRADLSFALSMQMNL